ncbi:Formate/nitrite transporter [Lentinula raphanica]|uniref:Formate/nitrite transporter n=1 Tax=Lentinula raphanica TaxID=153919 RepID=A0AA38NZA7_9AGAR|nr:Formate/nitrite transporter [Lentinula raphanica]KAJ3975190.1 Formate/nitrite transporter [Lentinula raphanica]
MQSLPESTLKPEEVTLVLVQQAVTKHRLRYDIVFFKAVLAGLMLSLGALMNEIVSGGTPALSDATANPAIPKILGGFVFPSGFVLIPMLGLELLTSNMMVFPMGIASGHIPWWSLPVNWLIVTFGNLAGSLFSAAILVHYSDILSSEPFFNGVQAFASKKAVVPEWHQIFLRGIGCNILVCIAIWLSAGAKDTVSKLVAIWIPIWIFVACSFDHVIANMFYIPLGIMFDTPGLSAAYYIRKSLIATYLGNIVGAFIVWGPAAYFYIWEPEYQIRKVNATEAGTAKDIEAGYVKEE